MPVSLNMNPSRPCLNPQCCDSGIRHMPHGEEMPIKEVNSEQPTWIYGARFGTEGSAQRKLIKLPLLHWLGIWPGLSVVIYKAHGKHCPALSSALFRGQLTWYLHSTWFWVDYRSGYCWTLRVSLVWPQFCFSSNPDITYLLLLWPS